MHIPRPMDRWQWRGGWNKHVRLGQVMSCLFGGKKGVAEHMGKRTWKQNRGSTRRRKDLSFSRMADLQGQFMIMVLKTSNMRGLIDQTLKFRAWRKN